MAKGADQKTSIAVRNATTGRYVSKHSAAKRSGVTEKTTLKSPNTGDAVKSVAARVAGSKAVAERWYAKPNDLLGGRTPKKAVKDGDSERVVGLLLNVAGQ